MTSVPEQIQSQANAPPTRKRFFQIDVLKTIAIAFVLIDHMAPGDIHEALGMQFWERLAMPFFLIIMGFNMAFSFKNKESTSLKTLYSRSYFWDKVKRYILPFTVLYIASSLLGLYFGVFEVHEIWYLFMLPFWGPGNWFIPVLFTSILVFPLVYRGFTTRPKLTVAMCFLSEVLLGLILFIFVPLVPYGTGYYVIPEARSLMWIVRLNILFYLPAVGIGLWLSKGHDIAEKRNRLLVAMVPLSFIYVAALSFFNLQIQWFDGVYMRRLFWPDYSLLVYPYAALFILLALKYIPYEMEGRFSALITRISKSTYHIFLFQILFYAVWFQLNPNYIDYGFGYGNEILYWPFYVFAVVMCFGFGMLWYEVDRRIGQQIEARKRT